MKDKVIGIFLLIFSMFVSVATPYALAQDGNTQEITTVNTTTYEGTIMRNENNVLTIQTDDGVREIAMPSNVKITKNGMGVGLNDLNPRDEATIIVSDTGEVLSVDAQVPALANLERLAIPLLAIIGLGIITATLLSKKANKGRIKTTPAMG